MEAFHECNNAQNYDSKYNRRPWASRYEGMYAKLRRISYN